MAGRGKNGLKRAVLKAISDGGWHSVRQIALRVGYQPCRGLFPHMLRYRAWGLLERDRNAMGIRYRLTRRGRERLEWLGSR
jgi:hypothetical protein